MFENLFQFLRSFLEILQNAPGGVTTGPECVIIAPNIGPPRGLSRPGKEPVFHVKWHFQPAEQVLADAGPLCRPFDPQPAVAGLFPASGDGGGGLCRPLRRGGPLRAGRRAPALEALLADLPAGAALRCSGDGGLGGAALAAGLGAAADRGGGRRRQRRRAPGAGVLPGTDGPAGGGRLLDVPPAVPVHLPAGGADADRPAAGGG